MTAWTVQCGYAAYYANTVTVDAHTLDHALEQAIAAANDDPSWKSLDDCGPTFVCAVAHGADSDRWHGAASAIPVPERFSEGGAPPRITITVEGGIVQNVGIENGPAFVIVHDYDIDGTDPNAQGRKLRCRSLCGSNSNQCHSLSPWLLISGSKIRVLVRPPLNPSNPGRFRLALGSVENPS